MYMNDFEVENAVEMTCSQCGRPFIAAYGGPDVRYIEYELCPYCYEEADLSQLHGWDD